MATTPKQVTLTNSSTAVLNAIRNTASTDYRDRVPIATPDADSIRNIGGIIMDYPALQNEFLSALINRIARVIVTSKLYDNPWRMFKKGILEHGESVEEIFVGLAKPHQFDPEFAVTNQYAREMPNVRSAFHVMNYQKFYKTTINRDQLRTAFLSWDGVNDLIERIIEQMYTSANYDEFLVMKYLLARRALNGQIALVDIGTEVAANDYKGIVSQIKSVSNKMEFMNNEYNPAGVYTQASKSRQVLLISAEYDAKIDVEVLASAFNLSKAEFMGRRVLVDSFGTLDTDRLAQLFEGDANYTPLTSDEIAALNSIPCMLVDEDFWMIFDNVIEWTEKFNGEGLDWHYWLHTWKTFSSSPFANSALFAPVTGTYTPIIYGISDDQTVSVAGNRGTTLTISLVAELQNVPPFANKALTFSFTNEGDKWDGVTLLSDGTVIIAPDALSSDNGVAIGDSFSVSVNSVAFPNAAGISFIFTVTA